MSEKPPGWWGWKFCLDHCWITMTVRLAFRMMICLCASWGQDDIIDTQWLHLKFLRMFKSHMFSHYCNGFFMSVASVSVTDIWFRMKLLSRLWNDSRDFHGLNVRWWSQSFFMVVTRRLNFFTFSFHSASISAGCYVQAQLMCIMTLWHFLSCRALYVVNYVCAHNCLLCRRIFQQPDGRIIFCCRLALYTWRYY